MTMIDTTAETVTEGDFLVDLDNGYVFEDPESADTAFAFKTGGYYAEIPDTHLCIMFHDRYGNENYLILDSDHPIRVNREK